MAGTVGLTDKQKEERIKLEEREKPHTDNMLQDYAIIMDKFENPLPAGMKTYCKKWLVEQLYDRRKGFSSKYTDKGNICEDGSIDFLNEYFLMGMKKNEEFFSNEFIQGTPDILPSETDVWDVKNSWSPDSFPLFDAAPDFGYKWQLTGYMALTGRSKARLIYCLMDAPINLIEDEARRVSYKSEQSYDELLEYYKTQMTYDDVNTELRVKWFDFDRDDDAIKNIEERVMLCRIFIKSLLENMDERSRIA